VASETPATSTRPSDSSSFSAARIGAAVSTGEAIRTRRRAVAIRLAIRWESSGPRPGENQARTATPSTSTGGMSNAPLPSTRPRVHSSSKFRAYARTISSEATLTSTFSSRVHESRVQFVEPVHTAARSRTVTRG
jgi:hypothetical protein